MPCGGECRALFSWTSFRATNIEEEKEQEKGAAEETPSKGGPSNALARAGTMPSPMATATLQAATLNAASNLLAQILSAYQMDVRLLLLCFLPLLELLAASAGFLSMFRLSVL